MTYNIDIECEIKFDFDTEMLYRQAVDAVLDYLNCPYEASVNLLITDEDGIREINAENRNIDAVTDVLSFPMNEFTAEGCFDDIEEDPDAFDPDTGELTLGDIVICAQKITSQAEEYGHSEVREFSFLIVHSMLHLAGFDHIEDSDRARMEEAQSAIMNILKIPR